MKKKFLVLLTLYIILAQITIAFALPVEPDAATEPNAPTATQSKLEVLSESAILMDATTGEILYEKNIHKKQYPASITKLMTVLLALEYGKLDDIVTFSKDAVFGIEANSSHIAIDVGEQLTLRQSLYAIMLQSANEVSLGVAEHIDGSVSSFAEHMTKRAIELGAKNTHFVNANGLHDENHYTTAYDMALIAKEIIKQPFFRELASTTYYDIPPTNIQPEVRHLYAQHKMIKQNTDYYYEGCEGGKTGFTNEALNTLVTFAKKGDTELIAVVLKSPGAAIYKDTTAMFDYGFENFETKQVFSAASFSRDVKVTDVYNEKVLDAGNASIYAENDLFLTLPKGTPISDIVTKVNLADSLKAPVKSGEIEGTMDLYYKNEPVGTINLLSASSVENIPIDDIKQMQFQTTMSIVKIISMFLVVTIIGLIVIVLFLRELQFRKRKKARQRRRRERYQASRENK